MKLKYILMPKLSKGSAHFILIAIVVVLALVVLAFATGSAKVSVKVNNPDTSNVPSAKKDETVLYENDSYAFSLRYPETWTVKKGSTSDPVVTFVSKKESSSDAFTENMFVTITDLSSKPNLSSSEAMAGWIKENKSGEYGSTFDVLTQKSIAVDGFDAEQVTYVFTASGFEVKGMITIVMKDNKAYLLSYTAEAKSFDTFTSEVAAMINSFAFKK